MSELRNKYFSNQIFKIGDIVEDTTTGESMQILDRGTNYLTVASSSGIVKKWLNEVKEPEHVQAEIITETVIPVSKEFTLTESGQVELFGYETKNFNTELSELIIEQMEEFSDLYVKHQIIKCLDIALNESDMDRAYELLQKVEDFYSKNEITPPFILEVVKNDIERTRLAEIIATVAGIKANKNNNQTISEAITALRDKYKTRQQWEVLQPLFKLATSAGLINSMATLPFSFKNESEAFNEVDVIFEAISDHEDLLIEDLEFEDIATAFEEDDYSTELISEVLSLDARIKLGNKMHQRSPQMGVKRERALTKSASSSVLLARARRLAETMLKRRMFHKSPEELSRQEKERFEAGASKRTVLIARLAQKLVGKVRQLQTTRMHRHTPSPVSNASVPHPNTFATPAGAS